MNSEKNGDDAPSVDWTAAQKFLKKRFERLASRVSREDREDLVAESMARLLRAVRLRADRSQQINNFEAFMTRTAQTVWLDHLRRSATRYARFMSVDPLPEVADVVPSGPFGDELDRLRFLILERFRLNHSPCVALAMRFFEGHDWKTVSEDLGEDYSAVRQRWSRCVKMLRRTDDGTLASFLGELHSSEEAAEKLSYRRRRS